MSQRVFLMCHVPKTAGTSVSDIFAQFYGVEHCKILGVVEHSEIEDGIPELYLNIDDYVRSGFRLFSGHIPIPTLIDIKRAHDCIPIQIILTIREPISHFYSAFLQSKLPESPFTEEKKELTVRDFLINFNPNQIFDASCVNVLCRFLSGRLSGELTVEDYKIARRALHDVDFIFDGDDLGSSVFEFENKYHEGISAAPKFLNSNSYSRTKLQRDSVTLLPRVANLLRFDCSLYGAATRMMREKNRGTFEHGIRTPSAAGRSVYLAEAVRRGVCHYEAENGFFEFRHNDLFLHPPLHGATRVRADNVAAAAAGAVLCCTVTLYDRSAGEVRFRIRVADGRQALLHEIDLPPGGNRDIQLSLDQLDGQLSIEFSTEMAGGENSNAFAWATFGEPRIQYVSDLTAARRR